MKKVLLFFALAIIALTAKSQGFSVVCETGQSLYYRIIDKNNLFVEVTRPHKYNLYNNDSYGTWQGYAKPVGDIVIPSKVRYKDVNYTVKGIDQATFNGCDEITSVVIPNTVTTIGNSAFYRCEKLASVSIPGSVTTIGNYAFYACKALKSVTLPYGLTTIEYWAFAESGLKEIEIPNSVQSIGYWAFADTDIKEIYIPGSLTDIRNLGAFDKISVSPDNPVYDSRENCNAVILTKGDTLVLGSNNAFIPNNVKAIGRDAFNGCKGLKTITIPSSVTTIRPLAFEKSGLEELTIPATVECVGGGAFSDCENLKSLVIESPTTNMTCGWNEYSILGAVEGCPNLTMTLSTTPLKLKKGKYTIETWSWEDGSSSGDAVYRILVPSDMVETYKNSDWGKVFEFREMEK